VLQSTFPAYLLVLAEIISSTLMMEAICSSNRSVATQQTTQHHIPEDDSLQICKFDLSIPSSMRPGVVVQHCGDGG
jgi:hypothetical protein